MKRRTHYFDSSAFHDHCQRLAVIGRKPSPEHVAEMRELEEAPPASPTPTMPSAPKEKRPLAA